MGWIKDIHDIGVQYFPKKESLDVWVERDRSTYYIYYVNTSERPIEMVDIHINNVQLNSFNKVNGLERDTEFILQNNQQKEIKIYSSKDDVKPKTIQFYLKSRFEKVKKMEFHL